MATFAKQIAASGDDGTEITTIVPFNNNGNQVYFAGVAGFAARGFLRFTGVTIPAGATISAAILNLHAADNANAGGITYKVQGFAEDSAAAPVSSADWNSRSLTSASASGTAPAAAASGAFSSFDFAAVVQEIVSRPGWASGNALCLVVDSASTSSAHAVASRDMSTTLCAELAVTYTEGGGSSGSPWHYYAQQQAAAL